MITRFGKSMGLAGATYVILWVPALLVAGFLAFIGYIGSGFAGLWNDLPFLLALPVVLIGVFSFRASAIVIVFMSLWDVMTTTWPHVTFADSLDSTVDLLLFGLTVTVVLVAILSPFASIRALFRHILDN